MGDGVTTGGVPIGPCGDQRDCLPFSPDRSLEAYVYLMENYACDGKLTVQDFYQAIDEGHWDEVAHFVLGSWQYCQAGDWCSLELEGVQLNEQRNKIKTIPPPKARRFAPTFELAIRNGLASPNVAFDQLFGKHIRIGAPLSYVLEYLFGTCGWELASLEPNNFHFKNYGTVSLTLQNQATPKDLKLIQQIVVEMLSQFAKRPIDPNRAEVTAGPNQRRTIYDPKHRDANGQYRTHEASVPTVQIKILPPSGCRAGSPSS